jgi:hypothetical protein
MTIQERWDGTFAKLDRSCPAQRADEDSTDYLRRLSRIGRRYIPANEEIARVRFDHTLPDETVPKFSELMRQCVEKNLRRTDNMVAGEMRSIMRVDENTGQKTREWVGPTSFVRNTLYGHRDCRRVTRINAPSGSTLWQSSAETRRNASGGW